MSTLREFCGAQRRLAEMTGQARLTDWYGSHDLLAQLGQEFTGRPLPDVVEPGEPQRCFGNAYRLARRITNLRYVEGVATRHGVLAIPIAHAWCIDENDQVWDPTWTGRDGTTHGADYLGVVIPLEEVHAALQRNEFHWSVFESDWRGDFEFLRTRWREVIEFPRATRVGR